MNPDKQRIQPLPTETIEINIVATVRKRDDYQEQIESISNCVIEKFPELDVHHMNSPLKIRIKTKQP